MDHVPPSADDSRNGEKSDLERNVKSRSTWLRLLFMIVFALLYALSRVVTAAVVVVQFFHVLLTGDTNEQLKSFGHSLAIYSYQVVEYLTFNSETRPYPLDASWPQTLADLDEGGPA
jgi:hypothetical protein